MELTYPDPKSGANQKLQPHGCDKLIMWRAYIVFQAKNGYPLKWATDILWIDSNGFDA